MMLYVEISSTTLYILASDASQPLLIQSQPTTNVAQRLIVVMEQHASSLALNQATSVLLDRTQNVFIETQTIQEEEEFYPDQRVQWLELLGPRRSAGTEATSKCDNTKTERC